MQGNETSERNEKLSQVPATESNANQDAHYKKLLFVDQSLEELFTQYNSQDTLLAEPYKYLRDGNPEAAKKSLRQILINPTAEIRHKLWAWQALRHLGETPPLNVRDDVRGVVFEIPTNGWVDTLAVFSDGRVRYLNGKVGIRGLIIWEDTENPQTKPLAMRVIVSAKALVGKSPVFDRHKTLSPTVAPRITVLTYRGLYSVSQSSEVQKDIESYHALTTDESILPGSPTKDCGYLR